MTISSGTMIRAVLIGAFFALMWFLRDIILVVITAVIVASAVEPMVHFFAKRNVPRLLSLVLIYAVSLGFFAGLFYFFVPALIDDVSKIAQLLPKYADMSSFWDPLSDTASVTTHAVSASSPSFAQSLIEGQNLLSLFKSGIEEGGVVQSVSVFFGGFLSFILIIVLSFYLAAQEKGIENFLRLISPVKSRSYVVSLWKRSQEKIGLWFQGQMLLGVLVGVLAFLGLTVLGIPSALFLAFIMMIFEIIPVFGPILAAVPGVAVAITEGIRVADPGLTAGLIVATFYFIIQQFESHLIYPLVVRKVIGIDPVLVILALVIGAKMAGFLGILISVPITAIIMEFLNDIAKERKIFED